MNLQTELPDGWTWTTVGEVCSDVQYGWTTSAAKTGKVRLLRTTDITSGKVDWDTVPFCKYEPSDISKYLLEDGDIVISRAGSVGESLLLDNPPKAVFASYLIRFKPLLNKKYVACFLRSPMYWKSISEKKLGIAVPNVNATKLKEVVMPLPPLPEQRRIVSKLEELFTKLDAGVEALKKAKVQLKQYRQSVLKYAFEGKLTEQWRKENRDKIEIVSRIEERIQNRNIRNKNYHPISLSETLLPDLPEGWTVCRISDIADKMQYGSSDKATDDRNGIAVLRMGNIQDGLITFDNLKYYPKDWKELNTFLLHDGDVLFNRTNSMELVGKTATYKSHYPKAVFASYLIRVQVDSSIYFPELLSHFINSVYGRRYIMSVVSQQVGQANVNGTKLSSMPIPVPAVEEQRQIISELESRTSIVDNSIAITEREVEHAMKLRQSILMLAFSGRLVYQNPADEPAVALLQGMQTEKTEQRSSRISAKARKSVRQRKLI